MTEKVKVANTSDVAEGSSKIVEANGTQIALFNIKGEFYAISNTCVHQGGSLGDGFVSGENVTCPLHAWDFNVKTGESESNPGAKVKTFKVIVEGNDVFVEI